MKKEYELFVGMQVGAKQYEQYVENVSEDNGAVEYIVLDELREQKPISATDLSEKNVYRQEDKLPKESKPYRTKKVVFVVAERCGKTTLMQNLAHLYAGAVVYKQPTKGVGYIGVPITVTSQQATGTLLDNVHMKTYLNAYKEFQAHMEKYHKQYVKMVVYRVYPNGKMEPLHDRNSAYLYDTRNFTTGGERVTVKVYENEAGERYFKYGVAQHSESGEYYGLMVKEGDETCHVHMVRYRDLATYQEVATQQVGKLDTETEAEYQHYKGGVYTVKGLVTRKDNQALYVYYIDHTGKGWLRPYAMFTSTITTVEGVKSRFAKYRTPKVN